MHDGLVMRRAFRRSVKDHTEEFHLAPEYILCLAVE
jgi:hypothetical protein